MGDTQIEITGVPTLYVDADTGDYAWEELYQDDYWAESPWGGWWHVHEWKGYVGVAQKSWLERPDQSIAAAEGYILDHSFDPTFPPVEDPNEYYYTYQMLGPVSASVPGYWWAYADHYKVYVEWWAALGDPGGLVCPITMMPGVCPSFDLHYQFTSSDDQEVVL